MRLVRIIGGIALLGLGAWFLFQPTWYALEGPVEIYGIGPHVWWVWGGIAAVLISLGIFVLWPRRVRG